MGRKCSVFGCKTGYASAARKGLENSIPMYGFPEDPNECQAWILALPNKDLTHDLVQNKT